MRLFKFWKKVLHVLLHRAVIVGVLLLLQIVCMVVNLTELAECITAVQAQTYNCAMITFRSARTVKIQADPGMDWTLDGEKEEGQEEVLVQNLHHAVRIMKQVEQNV